MRSRARGKRRLLLILGSAGLGLVALVALAVAWGPMQRSRQLAAIDACRDGNRIAEARELAAAFARDWGATSSYVVAAVTAGHGPLEARIEWCRLGGHLDLLSQILGNDTLTPAQRGQVCSALAEQWPDERTAAGLPAALPSWATAPESEPALAEPALRLLTAISTPAAAEALARAASDGRLGGERAVAAALALAQVQSKRGEGISVLLATLGGAHRTALLAAVPFCDSVRDNAVPADAGKLLALLNTPDSVALGLAGLGGKRFQLGESDGAGRAALSAQLAPFLVADANDAVLAGALLVVHRQRLTEARGKVIALLPRLASRRPEQLPADDLADLLGRSLISCKTPAATAAAEELVAALGKALASAETRLLATAALARVQAAELIALRTALDQLAAHGDVPVCRAALTTLVGTTYGREDIAKAGEKRGWTALLAEDRRKRARYDAITAWLTAHKDETTAATASAVLKANKAELDAMRSELSSWMESKDPLPLGVTKASLDALTNQVQIMHKMVGAATHL